MFLASIRFADPVLFALFSATFRLALLSALLIVWDMFGNSNWFAFGTSRLLWTNMYHGRIIIASTRKDIAVNSMMVDF